MRHLEADVNIRARLFDDVGAELSGAETTPAERELAAAVLRSGQPQSRLADGLIIEARPVPERAGRRYFSVSTLPLGPLPSQRPDGGTSPRRGVPPGPLRFLIGESTSAIVSRLVAALLTAGLLCYLLTRYIVSPVVKLREVTRQVTEGDLSARVGPRLGKRKDELAAMGHDFDEMASRIETLVGVQTRLLRDISHELRSPLARLSVSLSRLETEPINRNREQVDLATLLREVVEDADFEGREQNRSVVISESDECRIEGSASLLRSAVENVVRNAVRYTPEGTSVKVSLRCCGNNGGRCAVINVRDEGPGVPPATLSEIFRPFFRVDESRTRKTGGTGLGLAITERAVRLHGGTVEAANIPGGGFVVGLKLPVNGHTLG